MTPQSAGINVQLPQSESTPRRLTLFEGEPFDLKTLILPIDFASPELSAVSFVSSFSDSFGDSSGT